jgi:hypothetical protein
MPGHPSGADRLYGQSVGLPDKRAIQRRGGAAKLASMDPDAAKVLLKTHQPGDYWRLRQGGLRGRGMERGRKAAVRDQKFEALVQQMLKERGLLK